MIWLQLFLFFDFYFDRFSKTQLGLASFFLPDIPTFNWLYHPTSMDPAIEPVSTNGGTTKTSIFEGIFHESIQRICWDPLCWTPPIPLIFMTLKPLPVVSCSDPSPKERMTHLLVYSLGSTVEMRCHGENQGQAVLPSCYDVAGTSSNPFLELLPQSILHFSIIFPSITAFFSKSSSFPQCFRGVSQVSPRFWNIVSPQLCVASQDPRGLRESRTPTPASQTSASPTRTWTSTKLEAGP